MRGCAGCGGHAGASTGRVRPREACGKTRARRAAAAWCLMSGRVMGMLRMAGPGVERSVFFASPRGAAARKAGVRRVKREATPSDDNSNSCEKAEAEEESLARNEEEESQVRILFCFFECGGSSASVSVSVSLSFFADGLNSPPLLLAMR